MSQWQGVSNTAHFTAQIWVRNGFPKASLFNTRRGKLLYHTTSPFLAKGPRLVRLPVLEDILLARHRMIERILLDLDPDQVIELAAGLSPRGLWYSEAFDKPYLDVDLPGIVKIKEQRIGSAAPSRYRLAAMDLDASEDYHQHLLPYLKKGKTAVIAEGLLLYLPRSLQERIFSRIARLIGQLGGGCFLADVHHEEDFERAGRLIDIFRRLLHTFSRTPLPEQIANPETGHRLICESGFGGLTIHRPQDWRKKLDLDVGHGSDAGLSIYQAAIAR
jgi:O-methyltransferase involved in polyketide biosynthesis